MAADWYRRKSWSKTDEEEFFAKLSRTRKDGRAQYLKIQAIELVETKEPQLLEVAKELLSKVLNEYPEDNLNKASVYNTFGDVFKLESDIEKAIEYYKNAIDFEKIFPNVITQASLNYAELIVKNQFESLYPTAEEILQAKIPRLLFPNEKYMVFSLLAIINSFNSNDDIAKKYTELANENAQSQTSGLRYHKNLGLVSERDSVFEKLIKKFL